MDENNDPIKEVNVNVNVEGPTTDETKQNAGAKKQNTMGLVGFIFSLVGLIVAALPCGVVALITGIMGVTKFDASKEKGKGLAIAGIVIGAIDIVAGIINIVISMAG